MCLNHVCNTHFVHSHGQIYAKKPIFSSKKYVGCFLPRNLKTLMDWHKLKYKYVQWEYLCWLQTSIKQTPCPGTVLIAMGNAHRVPRGVLALGDMGVLALGTMGAVECRWLWQKTLHYWSSEDPELCFYGFLSFPPSISRIFEYLYQEVLRHERHVVRTIKWILIMPETQR